MTFPVSKFHCRVQAGIWSASLVPLLTDVGLVASMHTEGLEALLELEHLLLHSLPFPGPNCSLPGLALTSLQRPFPPEYWNPPISFSPPDTISNEAHNMLSLFTNYQQLWVWDPPNMALSEPVRPSLTYPSQLLSWSQCLPSKLSGSLLKNPVL